MRTIAVAVLVVCCAILVASAKPAVSSIPDTLAGRVLRAWLDAFNSGDRAQIEAYHTMYEPDSPVDQTLSFREQTGGFELLGIDSSAPRYIEFRVKEKASPTTAVGRLDVKDGDPPRVASFRLRAIPKGMTAADMAVKVDSAIRARVIDGIAKKLTDYYVFPDTAKKMVDALRAHHKKGDYDAIANGYAFASTLTDHLQAVSHDKHLEVECVPRVLPKDEPDRDVSRPIDAETRARLERDNCGFEKAERLGPNIGYLKFNYFGIPEVCRPVATAAMGFLGNVDAIIFDLRGNGGGHPEMVAWLSSYLFKDRTHLNDLYDRRSGKTTEYWTHPDAPGKKLVGKPVYVLTSRGTFSGAEEFSYNLKNLKRATIVGETTGGGAHPTGSHRVEDHFTVAVPFARAVNPISKTNWEGKGVEPDVKVAAGQALDVAKQLATDELKKHPPR